MKIGYIRSRTFSGLLNLPIIILVAFSKYIGCIELFFIFLAFLLFFIPLSLIIHEYLINDLSCVSYKISGNIALEKGYDPLPKNQDKKIDYMNTTEIYKSFRTKSNPELNTSGFIFFTYHKLKRANLVFFYEYNDKDVIKYYEIYMGDRASFFDKVKEKKLPFKRIKNKMRFIELPKL